MQVFGWSDKCAKFPIIRSSTQRRRVHRVVYLSGEMLPRSSSWLANSHWAIWIGLLFGFYGTYFLGVKELYPMVICTLLFSPRDTDHPVVSQNTFIEVYRFVTWRKRYFQRSYQSIISAVRIRWPKYWSFNFSISASNQYSGLISLKID